MLTEQNGIQVDKFYPPTDWQYSFPEGYTRLDYLTFTNAQYIELNFKANQDTRVITEVSFSTVISDQAIFSSRDTKTTNTFSCILVGHKIRADYNTTRIQTVDPIINTYYKIDFNKNNFYINGNLETTFTYANFQSSYNMTIGVALVSGATPASYLRGNLKQTIIFDNGTLAFNLVPVKRNSDNKPGMYDLVNDVFYVNQGTGEFVMGPELYSNNSQIDIRQKNNTNFVEKYKFNANNELIWANPQLNLSGPVNYSVVGSPTIVDNVVSGLSSSNYIANNNTFDITSNFEICVKINSWGNINTVQNFCSLRGNVNLNLRFDATGTIINGVYGSLSTQWNNIATNLTVGLPTTIKVSGNGTNITITTIQNSVSQSSTKTISELGLNGNYTIYYGRGGTTGPFTSGYIDLKETYIKVNDKLWFYGKNYTSENYAPVPAGLNYNNTTTPSIGYVNTQTQVFTPAPTDGIKYSQTRDIKAIPPEDNTITLLYGVASDFSKYSLFGLQANVSSGTYDVYIDDVLYTTVAGDTQTDIDFSTLGTEYVSIGTCITPEELVLHKIVIKPTTSGETITRFRGKITVGATGNQNQGVLWTHFELENAINIRIMCSEAATNHHTWNRIVAVTAKNNKITFSASPTQVFRSAPLKYIPILYASGNYGISQTFQGTNSLKRVQYMNTVTGLSYYAFATIIAMEQINIKELTGNITDNIFPNARALKILPKKEFIGANNTNTLTSATQLYPTKINCSASNTKTKLDMYGTSTYPMRGLRGLKVSNEAPFTGTSPQINVSYTGLGRDELLELFNSMPDVSQATDGISRAIDITATSGNNLTLSGNATINSEGILSSIDSSSSCITPSLPTDFHTMEMMFKVKKADASSNSYIPVVAFGATNGQRRINANGAVGHRLYYSNSEIIIEISNTNFDYITAAKNGYYIKLNVIKENTNYRYKLSLSIDKINWVSKDEISINNICYGLVSLLRSGTGSASGTPQMFLEETYIKVDNNYIMKGYLTDNDRLIATNKGWTITG